MISNIEENVEVLAIALYYGSFVILDTAWQAR